ncbi:ATP-binding protein [Streptomyces sp. NBC_01433]|uniref:AAA family ATPase n=1 Tax=Streptomyces sp. NBC_01433 TaxID=2903864 RepID=UPI0022540AAC|nr:ATP-binding protein [Streptomyces sp. NBC_01433]MCX4682634.1 ATP-binding protein [Streptomyces sp. NBC_01433]MCX4682674.1 ATP-binding protein [Streptomyces sp. NBC_01433]
MTPLLLDDTLVHVAEERLGSLLRAQQKGTMPPEGKTEITRIMRTLAGRSGPARLVLMAGLQGSRKTKVARALEAQGFLRFSPDERVWETYGHYGRDFPRGEYRVREQPILEEIAVEVREALDSGRDVVVDHGFWTASEREKWRRIGEEIGAAVTLVHLPGTHQERWDRIKERNQETYDNPNAMWFSEADLLRHAARFEAPGVDEPHVTYTGDLDPVLRALEASADTQP